MALYVRSLVVCLGFKIGHIEDVVVDSSYRGFNLGLKLLLFWSHWKFDLSRIIQELRRVGEAAGCYKVILDCSEKNVGFYERCGFVRKEVCMAWYIQQPTARL